MRRKVKPGPRFRVRLLDGKMWISCLPLNAEAEPLIHHKKVALYPSGLNVLSDIDQILQHYHRPSFVKYEPERKGKIKAKKLGTPTPGVSGVTKQELICSCGGGENNGHSWNCPWQIEF